MNAHGPNLVLIGMPGSGKSTVGQRLAAFFERPFVDTDAMIVEKAGCSIPEIFAQQGEPVFRDLETCCIREAAAARGSIIATGGGMVQRAENVAALSASGVLLFINRSPESILGGCALQDRPLVQGDMARLEALYQRRLPLYLAAADAVIPDHLTVDEAVRLAVLGYVAHTTSGFVPVRPGPSASSFMLRR
ncbi:MAG: shikimate kinase [Desulfovibrionaceae bacterium]|nr:shikimate kinase [Desulfovibrionaceae bacterium]